MTPRLPVLVAAATCRPSAETEHEVTADEQEGQQFWVEKIVGQRGSGARKEYCVRWEGYGEDDDTWEPAAQVEEEVEDLVWQFLEGR